MNNFILGPTRYKNLGIVMHPCQKLKLQK